MKSTYHVRIPLRPLALAILLFLLASWLPPAPGVNAGHTPDPTSVTIAGSLQSELGCPGDWQPDCITTHLTYDAGDDVWQGTFSVPAGNWEYKAALNDSWTENYGLHAAQNGANIPLALGAQTTVKFYYDHKTHWVTDNQTAVIAAAPGSFQSELGCAGDWDPGCLRSWLQDPDGDGLFSFSTTALPAGDYLVKVAIDESWDENYGADGQPNGPDIPFSVPADGTLVLFQYEHTSHILTVAALPPVDLAALARPPVQHPVEDEVLYFTLPDRFNDGDPRNNCGAYAGPCVANDTQQNVLTHGYLPSDKGYYHGGDLKGLREKLPYLKGMGVTAIWVGPIFKNKPVQPDSTNLYGRSSGYHGYWVLDFKQVDPHLGTTRDFKDLVNAAHAMGIQVFMDIITNHTADVIQYQEGSTAYRNKTDFPYVDVNGNPFDDAAFAYAGQPDYQFPAMNLDGFPYTPFLPAGEENAKNPAWLNDPLLYHNRGDSSFVGENSLYGDFFGLDDLFTERKEVVEGMVDIYQYWIQEFGVDGFRIDTTKHVNMEFWQVFGPRILAAAEARGIDHFFAFGEVFRPDPVFLSEFSTEGRLQASIDFAFQDEARAFASRSQATHRLRDLFALDDYYIDSDSNAYAMPTFVGNHDMGRIGFFLTQDNPGATDAELLARSKLAHALMFFARGQPVIYYGDEQGFTGDGGDKDAREDMFPSRVASYNDNDLIGSDDTTAEENFDPDDPLYKALRQFAYVYRQHQALRRGAQIHRYSTDGPGIYAFSRVDRRERVEYIVAFNNDESVAGAAVPTFYPPGARFNLIPNVALGSPRPASRLTTDANGDLQLSVPPLGMVIYRAVKPIPASPQAPAIQIGNLRHGQPVTLGVGNIDGHQVIERLEVRADLDADVLAEVTFGVRPTGTTDYSVLGVDNNPPYRVFFDAAAWPAGTAFDFIAIVNDLNRHLNAAQVVGVRPSVEAPAPPGQYAIIHYLRTDGNYGDHTTGNYADFWGLHLWGDGIQSSEITAWTAPKPFLGQDEYGRFAYIQLTDPSQDLNYIVHRGDVKDGTDADRKFNPDADGPELWIKQGDPANYFSQADAQGYVTIHYKRPASDYAGWGLHLWQEGVTFTDWTAPKLPDAFDDYGAVFQISKTQYPALDFSKPLFFIVHLGDVKDTPNDRSFDPRQTASIWLLQDDTAVYPSRGAAEDYAIIHYHRDAGDYGDSSSSNFNDFWGMHVWEGALTPNPSWDVPVKLAGQDVFGIFFKIPLVDGAPQLAYILHRGDTKDPGPDQFLNLAKSGYEVWQIQGADPASPYVYPLP